MGSCKHPLKAFAVGVNPSGKTRYHICSYLTTHVEINQAGQAVACFDGKRSPYANRVVKDFIEIPCGKCYACRMNYARDWANRCLLEAQEHDSNYFVTFTYDNDHLPVNDFVDPVTGEIGQTATLVKRDMQLFFKRLRRSLEYRGDDRKLRYFMCGEYGSQTFRPHYHAIIFNLHLDDLKLYKKNDLGQNLYNSEFLQELWPYGYVVIGEVTWETCAYTARYILKKQYGSTAEIYDRFNFVPEYTAMSRRPGIARNYYEEHKDEIYEFDEIHISTKQGGRRVKPPRYYDKLYDVDYPEESKILHDHRKRLAELAEEIKEKLTDREYLDRLEVEERAMMNRCRALVRKEI